MTPKGEVEKKVNRRMTPGETEMLIKKLTAEMKSAAKMLEFEQAAYLRDRIQQLREGKK